jgi:hypothetical protein
MNYKLTIDVNLMHTETKQPAMDTLRRWKEEGKIDLIEADPPKSAREPAYGWPGAPPKANPDTRFGRAGTRGRPKKESGSGPNFKGVASVLFPNKDPLKLNMAEINNVAHLLKHHGSKNELFITANLKDFIDGGRRELLKSHFGVVAMTPVEAVDMLKEIEGWK